ncbi:class I SAM-dependent methyltransferase [Thiohalobacter thiocyanaticus]|uniref:Class I SAM-dependent methyltransferase n=1 Tax=Thiohalobacter thiocyanaticus TaxID=585455 RepID=A0A426QIP9_9GAMM|nr:methyltransferase domain-containing protein [Thiohalobacter thiocyanaticus]RRQ21641.1 class I SAM-dependent methyltransferase [Thiohalobacter thiocyanaticus]
MTDEYTDYLRGEKLYGDDFQAEDIHKWFMDEAEGYANLGAKKKAAYKYVYHRLNIHHAFRHLKGAHFSKALGIGSAYGDEFIPIIKQIRQIFILDPSDAFADVREIFGTSCSYIKPNPEGTMPFENNQFDLITSLGVMHHIPNVSYVMSECFRCLDRGGIMLLREPIISMGDWRKPRHGLTKRERGIPIDILDDIIGRSGFKIRRRAFCVFPLIPKLTSKLHIAAYNNSLITTADALLSRAFSWNMKYHRTKLHEKFAPASAYYILSK